MAPRPGLEPRTYGLTDCAAASEQEFNYVKIHMNHALGRLPPNTSDSDRPSPTPLSLSGLHPKKERVKRRVYASRQDAKLDVFDYIEGFYNRVRRHSHLDQLSPLAFEQLRTGS